MSTQNDKESQYRKKLIESCRKLSVDLDFHGSVEPFSFENESYLSLEDRLCIAIVMGSKETVMRTLELGADANHVQKGMSIYQLAEVHKRAELLPLLKTFGAKPHSNQKPKKRNS
ncbi:MAG: hypothetical protein AB7D28_02260 [Candidatus Berkiella sp.]|jgi:hypothetical protein